MRSSRDVAPTGERSAEGGCLAFFGAGRPGRPSRAELLLAALWYALLAGAILYPLRRRGFVLLLDWTPTPDVRWRVEGVLGVHDVPLVAVLKALNSVVPMWILQRVILFGIFWGAGMAAHVCAPARGPQGRLFAGTLYAINPFTFTRTLAGHWTLLVAYALAPFAAGAALALAGAPTRRRAVRAGAWIAGLAAISAHALLLAVLLAAGCAVALTSAAERRRVLAHAGVAVAVVAAGTVWWIVPAAVHGAAPRSGIETVEVFASRPADGQSLPVTLAGMRGFWISRFNPSEPGAWPYLGVALAAIAFGGAAIGVRDGRRRPVIALLLTGGAAFVVAMGVASPATAPVARRLYDWIPGFVAFREPHKFVLLLALAYAFLGAIAVERLFDAGGRIGRVLAVAALAVPLALTPQIFRGLDSRLRPVRYPAAWAKADGLLRSDPDRFSVLSLPWKLYVPLPFNDPDEPVANPTRDYFSVPVIASANPEIGPGLAVPDDPVSRRIDGLIARYRTLRHLGTELAPLGIKYVVLVPEVHPGAYRFLFEQEDLAIVLSSEDLVVFRNLAWARAEPAGP